MFKKSKISVAVATFVGALALPFGSAVAQSEQRIEITGSAIKRVASEGALPVQTFTAADIKRSGVTTVTDFIQQLPVMQGFTVAASSVGGGGGGITTASIHDVGEQYTLVLLNGRRVAPATSGSTIDINSIPLAAIERIEVLTDGASALYGSDAIAGVVNFILKKGESPLQVDARFTAPQQQGGQGYNLGISKGWGVIEKDGFSVFASLSYDTNAQLKAADRAFAKTGIIDFVDQQGRQLSFFNGSSRAVPPNVDVRYRNPTAANPNQISTTSLSPYLLANGSCPPSHLALGRQCFFDYTSSVEISPEQERTSLYMSGEAALGKSGFKAFATASYTDASILARIAPYPAEFSLPKTDALFTKYVSPYLTQFQRDNVSSVNVKYRLYELGGRAYDYRTKATHLVAGIEGDIAGWSINSAVTHSQNKQLQNYVGGFPLADKFTKALLVDRTIDPFPYTLGQLPAAQLAALKATQFVGTYNTTDIALDGADIRMSRDLFKMAGGAAQFAMGADVRTTSYKVVANPAVANAEILFDDPQTEYNLKRKSFGAFAEMGFPIMKGLELTAGLRFDSVGAVDDGTSKKTFGEKQDATTFNLKGRYTPTKNLLFRGSAGTGFRTASMLQVAQPQADFGVSGGSFVCPFTAAYDPKGYFARGLCWNGPLQVEEFTGGNPKLKPEHSKQWTLGMVIDPTENISVSLDYWNVALRDQVTSVSERLILTNPQKYIDLYTTKFKASNNQNYIAILLAPINIGRAENSGIDYDFSYKTKTNLGKFTGSIKGTYLLRSRYTTPGTNDQWETSMNRFGSNDAVSFRNIISATAAIDAGNWAQSLTMNYRNGYKDIFHDEENCAVDDGVDCIATQLDVPRYYTFDWQARFNASKNLTLTVGVQNLLDKEPPLSLRNTGSHQLGYDPRYASALGRTFYIQGSLKF